jgi:hypothetical protein
MQHILNELRFVPGGVQWSLLCGDQGQGYSDAAVPEPLGMWSGCNRCFEIWFERKREQANYLRHALVEADHQAAIWEEQERVKRVHEAARRLDGTHEFPPGAGA